MAQWDIASFKKAFERLKYKWDSDKPMIIGVRTPSVLPDVFDDYLVLIIESQGLFVGLQATTTPGAFYLKSPMNPNGAFVVAIGQYIDSHILATHGKGKTFHKAFALCGKLKGYRDNDKDNLAEELGALIEVGPASGVNIHSTGLSKYLPTNIKNWSAGCQVAQNNDLFQEKIIKPCEEFMRQKKLSKLIVTYTLLLSNQI